MMIGFANVWLNSPWIRLLLTCAFDYCWLGGIIWWYGNNINDDDDVDYDNDDESDDDNDDDDSRVHIGPHVCLERWLYSLSSHVLNSLKMSEMFEHFDGWHMNAPSFPQLRGFQRNQVAW